MITDATGLGVVQNETLIAGTHEATEGVGTVSILTDVLVFLALVDVLQDNGDSVRSVSRSSRAEFLEFPGSYLRTLLAIVAPSVADAATARRLRHGG